MQNSLSFVWLEAPKNCLLQPNGVLPVYIFVSKKIMNPAIIMVTLGWNNLLWLILTQSWCITSMQWSNENQAHVRQTAISWVEITSGLCQNLITTRKIYCYIAKGTKLLDFQVSFVIELEDLNFQCSGNQTTLHFGVFFFPRRSSCDKTHLMWKFNEAFLGDSSRDSSRKENPQKCFLNTSFFIRA